MSLRRRVAEEDLRVPWSWRWISLIVRMLPARNNLVPQWQELLQRVVAAPSYAASGA